MVDKVKEVKETQERLRKLSQIEQELTILIEADKKNWTHFYMLMKNVEENELWKNKYSSFTQWVKNFCLRTKTHESIIWNRKKAGKVYESYMRVQKAKGIEVAPLTEVNVSADSLVILDKINKYDEKAASELTEKVLNHSITKKDLREVYKSIRPEKVSNNPHLKKVEVEYKTNGETVGEKIGEANDKGNTKENACSNSVANLKSNTSISSTTIEVNPVKPNTNASTNADHISPVDSKKVAQKLTANQIVNTLCSIEWLGAKAEQVKRKYFKTSFEQNKYRAFTEFPVFTGTSRKSRRMDMLICENVTSENTWELNLHCIEIKVSKSDLVNDHKYTEYADFVDYMWLAVPSDLVEIAKEHTFENCGIISVDIDTIDTEENGKKKKNSKNKNKNKNNKTAAKIVVEAKKLDSFNRDVTLQNIVLKLM